MNQITYSELYDQKLAEGAILHTHIPFLQDYLTLHILLRKYQPKSVLEIGTHVGEGTQIICNALPEAKVSSLDLRPTESDKTLQHPALKGMRVGQLCTLPFTQLWGDSMTFQYKPHDAWFIDGEHDYAHPWYETSEAIRTGARLIIWHDADIEDVYKAITDATNADYDLYRVTGTRIAYALKK